MFQHNRGSGYKLGQNPGPDPNSMLLDPQHCNPYSSGRLVVLFCGSGRRANSPEPFLLAVGTSGRGRSSEQIAHIIRSVGKHYTRISEMSRCLLAMGNPGPHRAKLTRLHHPDQNYLAGPGINNSDQDLDRCVRT